jgi:hypothetical protein
MDAIQPLSIAEAGIEFLAAADFYPRRDDDMNVIIAGDAPLLMDRSACIGQNGNG